MQTASPILTGRDAVRIAAFTVATVAVVAAVGPWLHLGLVDDAFITFRCSANFAAGHGLVYNVGEPVESASNFLFALLVGIAMKIGATPEVAAFALNTFAIALMLVALRALAWPRAQSAAPSRIPISLAGVILVTQPAVWFYLSSGMETLFFSAFMFAGFAALVLRAERGISPAWTGVALGIAACVRMEAVAFAGLAAALLFAIETGRERWTSTLKLSLVFAGVFGPVLAWRWSFYGYPFPNAYYAKVDGGGADLWLRGLGYVGLWLILNWLALATVMVAARVGLRTSRIRTRVALAVRGSARTPRTTRTWVATTSRITDSSYRCCRWSRGSPRACGANSSRGAPGDRRKGSSATAPARPCCSPSRRVSPPRAR
ncbi:MAG: hypothetical protein IT350_10990 [Deltaproteobacteria bacterium]|nr:hypothetical protein [Deltaproteobacteria bacterium]